MHKKKLLLTVAALIFALSAVFFAFNEYIYWRKNTPRGNVPSSQNRRPSIPAQRFPVASPVATWTLMLTGDIIPARSVNLEMVKRNDFMWPLVTITDLLKNADLTLIDLEAPLLTNCPVTNEGMTFCGDARFIPSLVRAGVDVANLANNHTLNFGWEGLAETEQLLAASGIETTGFTASNSSPSLLKRGSGGVGEEETICQQNIYCSKFTTKTITPRYSSSDSREVSSIKIGFLGYNAVGQRIDRDRVQTEISAADKLVDVLIVSVHWGKEYTRTPETDGIAADDPIELGRLFVDWGADVVAGNHPHWYQGMEWYTAEGPTLSAKPIFYALGNTVFDQEWSKETKEGLLIKLTFNGTTPMKESLEVTPTRLVHYGQATLIPELEKQEHIELFNSLIQ